MVFRFVCCPGTPVRRSSIPDTRQSLLLKIRDSADHDAWQDFVDIYRPVICRLARRRGLQDADAQDVAQRVLVNIAVYIDQWQPGQPAGSFRRWLSQVARNAIVDWFRGHSSQAAILGETQLNFLADFRQPDPDDELEVEYRRSVFRRAAERVRPEFQDTTWQAFFRTCVYGETVADAADSLGLSVGAVYTARSRVMHRIKQEVATYDAD